MFFKKPEPDRSEEEFAKRRERRDVSRKSAMTEPEYKILIPILNGGRKFYPVAKRELKINGFAEFWYTDYSKIVEYFKTLKEAEAYVVDRCTITQTHEEK